MDPISYINPLKHPWDTENGLIGRSIYVIVIFFTSFVFFKEKLPEFLYYFVNTYLVCFLLLLICWIFKRINYVYFSKRINIIFAVTIDYQNQAELLKEYHQLINLFKEKLKDYNLPRYIKVKIKNVDVIFSDHSAAEAKTNINRPCSTLIISGMPIISKNITEFKFNFHYEFFYPGKKTKEKDEYYKEIMRKRTSKAFINSDWRLMDNIETKNKLSSDLICTTTFIVALTCLTIGEKDKAIDLFQPIIKKCNQDIVKFGPLIAELRENLFNIYAAKFQEASWEFDTQKMRVFVDKMTQYKPTGSSLSLALTYELEEDRENAIKYTKKAEIEHPNHDYSFKFNYIYFDLMEGKYGDAVEKINKLQERQAPDNININYILHFIDYINKQKKDIVLTFYSGIISMTGKNKELGIKDLKQFNKLAKNNSYKILKDKSIEIINKGTLWT